VEDVDGDNLTEYERMRARMYVWKGAYGLAGLAASARAGTSAAARPAGRHTRHPTVPGAHSRPPAPQHRTQPAALPGDGHPRFSGRPPRARAATQAQAVRRTARAPSLHRYSAASLRRPCPGHDMALHWFLFSMSGALRPRQTPHPTSGPSAASPARSAPRRPPRPRSPGASRRASRCGPLRAAAFDQGGPSGSCHRPRLLRAHLIETCRVAHGAAQSSPPPNTSTPHRPAPAPAPAFLTGERGCCGGPPAAGRPGGQRAGTVYPPGGVPQVSGAGRGRAKGCWR
jgi:hypothetical protein